MRHIFRQWRLTRHIERRIREEREDGPAKFGEQDWIPAQSVIDNYGSGGTRDVMNTLVDNGYLSLQARTTQSGVEPWVTIDSTKGQEFLPVFSGLILSELRFLGPLYSFAAGIGSVLLILGLAKA